MIQSAKNSFQDGLILDFSPENTTATTMTSALNATLLTFNGNEMALQNDYGNGRVETARLPEGYIPVGTCEFGDIIYIVSYNPILNKSLIGCFPSPERNISSEETSSLQLRILWTDFLESDLDDKPTGKLKTTTVKKIIYDKTINPGDKYSIYSSNISENKNVLSDYGGPIKLHGYWPKLTKIHVISIEESGKIVYLDSTLHWYDNYYITDKCDSDTQEPDIDSYRNLLNSGYSIFLSKVSGKLGLLIELEKITSFSCTHSVYTRNINSNSTENQDTEYYIYLNSQWSTDHYDVNPSGIIITKSKWQNNLPKIGIYKKNKDGNEYILTYSGKAISLPTESSELDTGFAYNKIIKFNNCYNFNSEDYASYLENSYETLLSTFLETNEVEEKINNIHPIIYLGIIGSSSINVRFYKSQENMNFSPGNNYTPTLPEEAITGLAAGDYIVVIYQYTSIAYHVTKSLSINPSEQENEQENIRIIYRKNEITEYLESLDYNLYYNDDDSKIHNLIVDSDRYMLTGVKGNVLGSNVYIPDDIVNHYFKKDILKKLVLYKISETQTKINDRWYSSDLSLLVWNYEVAPVMPYGVLEEYSILNTIDFSKINTKFIDINGWRYYNEGEISTLTIDTEIYEEYNKKVSEICLEFYDDKGFAAAYHIKDKNSYSGTFTETIRLNSSLNYRLDNINRRGESQDNAGILKSNQLYKVLITVKYHSLNSLGDIDPTDESEWVYFTRWFYTTSMFNDQYYTVKNFDIIKPNFALDISTGFKSKDDAVDGTKLYELKTSLYSNGILNESSTKINTLGAVVQHINLDGVADKQGNIELDIDVGLLNDFGTFSLNPGTVKKIDDEIDEVNSYTEAGLIKLKINLGKSYIETSVELPVVSGSKEMIELLLPVLDVGSNITTSSAQLLQIINSKESSFVDMGLGYYWAKYNLGAESESDYGDYYNFASVTPMSDNYTDALTKCPYIDENDNYTKYLQNAIPSNINKIQNNWVLDPEDDAATVLLGNQWRIPTWEEFSYLLTSCDWKLNSENTGYIITSNITQNSIYLPLAKSKYLYNNGNILEVKTGTGTYYSISNIQIKGEDTSIVRYALNISSKIKSIEGLKDIATQGTFFDTLDKKIRRHGYPIRPIMNISQIGELYEKPKSYLNYKDNFSLSPTKNLEFAISNDELEYLNYKGEEVTVTNYYYYETDAKTLYNQFDGTKSTINLTLSGMFFSKYIYDDIETVDGVPVLKSILNQHDLSKFCFQQPRKEIEYTNLNKLLYSDTAEVYLGKSDDLKHLYFNTVQTFYMGEINGKDTRYGGGYSSNLTSQTWSLGTEVILESNTGEKTIEFSFSNYNFCTERNKDTHGGGDDDGWDPEVYDSWLLDNVFFNVSLPNILIPFLITSGTTDTSQIRRVYSSENLSNNLHSYFQLDYTDASNNEIYKERANLKIFPYNGNLDAIMGGEGKTKYPIVMALLCYRNPNNGKLDITNDVYLTSKYNQKIHYINNDGGNANLNNIGITSGITFADMIGGLYSQLYTVTQQTGKRYSPKNLKYLENYDESWIKDIIVECSIDSKDLYESNTDRDFLKFNGNSFNAYILNVNNKIKDATIDISNIISSTDANVLYTISKCVKNTPLLYTLSYNVDTVKNNTNEVIGSIMVVDYVNLNDNRVVVNENNEEVIIRDADEESIIETLKYVFGEIAENILYVINGNRVEKFGPSSLILDVKGWFGSERMMVPVFGTTAIKDLYNLSNFLDYSNGFLCFKNLRDVSDTKSTFKLFFEGIDEDNSDDIPCLKNIPKASLFNKLTL